MNKRGELAVLLERWYDENKRALPWRETSDPYRIWVSEIILQQTRVAQGEAYYLRFVERFPDVKALAEASEDEVLKYWQGLGYYSRARNLHAAARQVMEGGGAFPDTYEGIRALKGVGDYTAAAIASFAYGLPHAVVDGNVYRVLSRYFGVDLPIDTTAGKRYFATLAHEVMDEGRPAHYNQAIMDFGALQCTPRCDEAQCAVCPLADSCAAHAEGRPEGYPCKQRTTRVSERHFTYIYIQAGGQTCLRRRAGGDIWQGLYEPVLLESDAVLPPEGVMAAKPLAQLLAQPDARLTLLRSGVRHQLSHRLLVADFYHLGLVEKPSGAIEGLEDAGYQWIPLSALSHYAVPRLVSALWEACGLEVE